MNYLLAFLIGGAICAVGQLLIDFTRLTPARILTGYVVAGVILEGIGLFAPLRELAGAGAGVPLCGFGSLMARGIQKAVEADGLFGIFTGGLTAGAAGITAAILVALISALLLPSREK